MPLSVGDVRILQSLQSHSSDVTTCDFAPNFALVTGSSDKTVRIWDWTVGVGYVECSKSPLRGHKYQVTSVRISPQGSMLASASVDGTAVLWNMHSLARLFTMTQVNGDAIRVCRFAPDSSVLVTAGDNGAVCVWDLVHRSLIRTVFEHEGTTQSLAFTPDSQYLVSACSLEVVKVWYVQDLVDTTSDTDCSPVAKVENAHDLGVFCVDVSKAVITDENDPLIKKYELATSGNSNEIKIWTIMSKSTLKHKNAENEVCIMLSNTYDGHNCSVTCIRYNNTGSHLISSSLDKLIKIWDHDGNCVATLEGHTRYVNCIAISKNGTLIVSGSTGSNDKLVLVWDLTGNVSIDSELLVWTPPIEGIPELQLVQNAETNDNEMRMLEKVDDISEGAINCCCFSRNGVLATASGDKLVKLFQVCPDNYNVEEFDCSPLEGHTYAVNHVEFNKDGTLLASCSLDGCTHLWNPSTGEKMFSLLQNSLAIKVCKFSPNNELLLTAGDDETAHIWNFNPIEEIAVLDGHLDTITSAGFSPDGNIMATTSFNGDFRLWNAGNYSNIHIEEDVHDGGIQNSDFSQNLEPIPNTLFDVQSYLYGTCGNDSMVKLWRISLSKQRDTLDFDKMQVKIWRSLHGHGGNVVCIRFSPVVGEIVCSTATDRQARIWSVYSADCLFVLDHDSIVTACSFSYDCSLLAIGCIDKTLWLWKLPQQLVFQSVVTNKIKCRTKALVHWTTTDVVKWLNTISFDEIAQNVRNAALDGEKLLTLAEEQICAGLDLNQDQTDRLCKELRWLKQDTNQYTIKTDDIPHEFLCPITHEVMRDPVTCSDGYTYEKNAIAEWFMSGKSTSPLTNEILTNTQFSYNHELRTAIHFYLDYNT